MKEVVTLIKLLLEEIEAFKICLWIFFGLWSFSYFTLLVVILIKNRK